MLSTMYSTVVMVLLLLTAGPFLGPCNGSPSPDDPVVATGILTHADLTRLTSVFRDSYPYSDLQTAYHATGGLTLLGMDIHHNEEICKFAKENVDSSSPQSLFWASSVARNVGRCALTLSPEALVTLEGAETRGTDISSIYHSLMTLKNIGSGFNSKLVLAAVNQALVDDETLLTFIYAIHISAEVKDVNVDNAVSKIPEVVEQADEVDGKYLQFESGLAVTSLFVEGAYKLAQHVITAPDITEDQLVMFGNYFISRKHVQTVKNAFYLVNAIETLSNNRFHNPVAVTMLNKPTVSADNRRVVVKVSRLNGASVGDIAVVAESAKRQSDGAVVLSRKPLKQTKDDRTVYELDFLNSKPGHGFYAITFNLLPANRDDDRLIGTVGAQVEVKVTTQVVISHVLVSVVDLETSSVADSIRPVYPEKSLDSVEADYHQKFSMSFDLLDDTTGEKIQPHQVFLRLTHTHTGRDIYYIAEPHTTGSYNININMATAGRTSFNNLSGLYNVQLIVGDSIINNPFVWDLVDLNLVLNMDGDQPEQQQQQQRGHLAFSVRPEIVHMFREAEKRPPNAVSNTFTVLVILPFIILIVSWVKLGANIQGFQATPSTIMFHIGLASVLGLYYCYWAYLNMFTTLKWLVPLGGVTFIAGNKLLKDIAQQRMT